MDVVSRSGSFPIRPSPVDVEQEVAMSEPEFLEKILPGDFAWLQGWLKERSSIVLEDGRRFLAEKRLRPLLRPHGLPDLRSLFAVLRSGRVEGLDEEVLEALTQSETWFFRDMPVFEHLRDTVLPALAEERAGRPLRIWSAGCSTGQEPYSLAMHLDAKHGDAWRERFRITATDLSARQIAHARDGAYDREAVSRGLPVVFLARYFTQLGTRWHIREDLREAVEFRVERLDRPWPEAESYDLILLRNVLPYFDMEVRLEVLWRVRKRLTPGGVLVLGAAETHDLEDAFERVETPRFWYYRLPVRTAPTAATVLRLGYQGR
jgi:chemotaxis protein methyltransferase CheR